MHPIIKSFTSIFLLMGITAGLCRAQHPQWVLSGNMPLFWGESFLLTREIIR
ncbi:MAG: hypothetical protein ACOZDD_03430 [Bacteroidota bacterium]